LGKRDFISHAFLFFNPRASAKIRGKKFPAYFSISFHKEVPSSTVSSQPSAIFLLKPAGTCRKVLPVLDEMS
jgi:hypothetical protein